MAPATTSATRSENPAVIAHPHLAVSAAKPDLREHYLPPIWRHKVNPATPDQINAGCDKKVA
jgi:hypothetical protein